MLCFSFVFADHFNILGYGGGGGGGGQGGSYTVVYGKPRNTGSLKIDVDVERDSIPIKYIGRKPFGKCNLCNVTFQNDVN